MLSFVSFVVTQGLTEYQNQNPSASQGTTGVLGSPISESGGTTPPTGGPNSSVFPNADLVKRGRELPASVGIVKEKLEAPTRIELVNNGFADRCLTTWLRRPMSSIPFNDSADSGCSSNASEQLADAAA